MDFVYVNRFNSVIQELQFSSHSQIYIREITMKRYEKITFLFNLYHFPDGLWKPLHLCYVNDIKQYGYTDSAWYQSDRIYDAHQGRVDDCKMGLCYCKPKSHHTFEIHPAKTKRYFEMILDIGDIADGNNHGKPIPTKKGPWYLDNMI